MDRKALIAMSGGVDSSVAAHLMIERGYECIGVTMRLHSCGTGAESTCGSASDIDDAKEVAARLGIEHRTVDFSADFEEKVIRPFARSYENGITPNPCIECNRYMKFDGLYRECEELGCSHIVTGHYVRIEQIGDKFYLKKAIDESKDQSYVLYFLTQDMLAHTLFPLGELTKSETREIAEREGFINAAKRDSQDICFVPDGNYARVVKQYASESCTLPGDYLDSKGRILGRHKGIIHYTIGQHKGLGISSGEPLYVRDICPENNTVILGRSEELFARGLDLVGVNWTSGKVPESTLRLRAKIRYRHREQWASVTPTSPDSVHIEFDEPQRAITRGQSAVLYDGDIVVGGGIIV